MKLYQFATYISTIAACLLIQACDKDVLNNNSIVPIEDEILVEKEEDYLFHQGQTVLGDTIEIPYTIDNIRKALENLPAETRSMIDESQIVPTHYYVKFHPKNEEELAILKNNKPRLMLSEVPLDREIQIGGTSYHDPSLPEDMPTYQYTTIPAEYWEGFSDTLSVENEVLIEAYIPDYDEETKTKSCVSSIPQSALNILIAEAYRLAGHVYTPETKASWNPSGRVQAYDNIVEGYVPIKGVRIRGTRFLTIKETLTDANGYYTLPSFNNKVNMKLLWEADEWDVRDGIVGQAVYDGPQVERQPWNVVFPSFDTISLAHSAIHRAAYRYYKGYIHGLSRPANTRKEKIAYIDGGFDGREEGVYGIYEGQGDAGIGNDIKISGKDKEGKRRKISQIFLTTCHELGHATHYTNVKNYYNNSTEQLKESWAVFAHCLLTRQEYSELNVDRLIRYGITLNGKWYEDADNEYNHQYIEASNNVESVTYYNKYTPLFIDLFDDYNQSIYLNYKGVANDLITPYDIIEGFPPSSIENLVFTSKSFNDVETQLRSYANSNPYNIYNITPTTITMVMGVYNY